MYTTIGKYHVDKTLRLKDLWVFECMHFCNKKQNYNKKPKTNNSKNLKSTLLKK